MDRAETDTAEILQLKRGGGRHGVTVSPPYGHTVHHYGFDRPVPGICLHGADFRYCRHAFNDFAEDSMSIIQMRGGAEGDEKLASVGTGS